MAQGVIRWPRRKIRASSSYPSYSSRNTSMYNINVELKIFQIHNCNVIFRNMMCYTSMHKWKGAKVKVSSSIIYLRSLWLPLTKRTFAESHCMDVLSACRSLFIVHHTLPFAIWPYLLLSALGLSLIAHHLSFSGPSPIPANICPLLYTRFCLPSVHFHMPVIPCPVRSTSCLLPFIRCYLSYADCFPHSTPFLCPLLSVHAFCSKPSVLCTLPVTYCFC